jgi:ATP-dependent DNA ligase
MNSETFRKPRSMGLRNQLDGFRAVAVRHGECIDFFSRRRKSFNSQYAHIVEALRDLPQGTVVDGLFCTEIAAK